MPFLNSSSSSEATQGSQTPPRKPACHPLHLATLIGREKKIWQKFTQLWERQKVVAGAVIGVGFFLSINNGRSD